MSEPVRRLAHFVGMSVSVAGFGVILWGLLLFLLQVFYWLKIGGWSPTPALSVFVQPYLPSATPSALDLVIPTFARNSWEWIQIRRRGSGCTRSLGGFSKLCLCQSRS